MKIIHYLDSSTLADAVKAEARVARLEGHRYNFVEARHFHLGGVSPVDAIVSDDPEIIKAYAEKGIGLWDRADVMLKKARASTHAPASALATDTVEETGAVQVSKPEVTDASASNDASAVKPRGRPRGRPKKVKVEVEADPDMPAEWPETTSTDTPASIHAPASSNQES